MIRAPSAILECAGDGRAFGLQGLGDSVPSGEGLAVFLCDYDEQAFGRQWGDQLWRPLAGYKETCGEELQVLTLLAIDSMPPPDCPMLYSRAGSMLNPCINEVIRSIVASSIEDAQLSFSVTNSANCRASTNAGFCA